MYKHHHRRKKNNRTGLKVIILVSVLALGIVGFLSAEFYHSRSRSAAAKGDTDEPLSVSVPPPSVMAPTAPAISAMEPPFPSKHDYILPAISNGLAPVISRIPTKEPVVFLGIDDGVYKQPFELQLMQDNHIKASLFLANRFIRDDPNFFQPFIQEGSLIEDHTLDHKLLSSLGYDQQRQEICDMADLEQQEFGRRPVLFRPPGGSYNTDTQRAAADCGMKAVVLWIAKANGGSMQFQIGHQLRAGDIVLMHFRPEFRQDMQAFMDAEGSAGLHTELLEEWINP